MPGHPRIYIPTFGRVDVQYTWMWLNGMNEWWSIASKETCYTSEEWAPHVVHVAHPTEATVLRERGCNVLETPESVDTIAVKRQWIFDQHDVDEFGPYAIMMDDDLRFGVRRWDDPSKLTQVHYVEGEFDRLMARILEEFQDDVPLVGLRNRSGSNNDTEREVIYNTRQCDVLAVNVETMRSEGWRFDRVALMEDFDFTLQVLTSGYRNALVNTHTRDDMSGRGSAGGASTERDMERQAAAAHRLAELWPSFVTVVEKNNKCWGDWGTRTDVRVSWAQAAKFGQRFKEIMG